MEKGGAHDKEGTPQSQNLGNVVRIPRDWFGPKEDLVPLGPTASQTTLVEPAEHRVDGRESGLRPLAGRDSSPTSASPGAPLDPNTFWGEDSSLIQDVVAAPAEACEEPAAGAPTSGDRRGIALPALRAPFRIGRARTGAVRTKTLAMTTCFFLIVIASLVAWQLGGSPSMFRASVASVARQHSAAPLGLSERQHIERPVRHLATTPQRSTVRRGARTHAAKAAARDTSRRRVPKPLPSASAPTAVIYHSSQPTSSPATTGNQASSSANSSPAESQSNRGTSTATVASAPTTHSSPAAFGTSGALGPMSSPDG